MGDIAVPLRIIIPTEQRTTFGHLLPCEYEFLVEPCLLGSPDDEPIKGWHILPITFHVERLQPGDSMCTCIDQALIERVISAAEVLSAGPFQS